MNKLQEFLSKDIVMQKIYQPMVIKCLLEAEGTMAIRGIAREVSVRLHGHVGRTSYYYGRLTAHPKSTLDSRGIATVKPGSKEFSLNEGCYIEDESERRGTIAMCDLLIAQVLQKDVNAKAKKENHR